MPSLPSLPNAIKPLPPLPADVWLQILRHLPPAALDAFSRTSRRAHRLATDDALFRARVLAGLAQPSSLLLQSHSYADLYRRSRAVRFAPVPYACPVEAAGGVRVVAVIGASCVLYDEGAGVLSGWPMVWTRDVADLSVMEGHVMESATVLADGGLGFIAVGGSCGASFITIDPATGDVVGEVALPHGAAMSSEYTEDALFQRKMLLPGGSQGQFLVYFTVEGELYVVRRTDGSQVNVWGAEAVPNGFPSLVRSQCHATGAMVVTGVVWEEGSVGNVEEKHYSVYDIADPSERVYSFSIGRFDKLVDVVESADRSVVARRVVQDATHVAACVETRGLSGDWRETWVQLGKARGSAVVASAEFELLADGRQIFFRPEGASGSMAAAGKRSEGVVVRVTNGTHSVRHRFMRARGAAFCWATLSIDGDVLFMGTRATGVISMFELSSGRCLHSVETKEGVRDIAVVGDHFIVATGRDSGKIHAWHFNRFCSSRTCRGLFPAAV